MNINYNCTCCKMSCNLLQFPNTFVLSEAKCHSCIMLIESGQTKECNRCKQHVMLKLFDGEGKTCPPCKSKLKSYYKKNKQKVLSQQRQFRNSLTDEQKKERYKAKLANEPDEAKEKRLDRHREYSEEYHKLNKNKINEKKREKCKCDICGAVVTKNKLKRHQRTIKCTSHKNDLKSNE